MSSVAGSWHPPMLEGQGWWENPRLAFAEGARLGRAAGLAEALEVAGLLYGPWKFDAADVWRGLRERERRAAERAARGS